MWKLTLSYDIYYKWYYVIKGNYMDFHSLIPTAKSCGFQMIEALHTFCACEFDLGVIWCAQSSALGCCHNFWE